MKFSVSIYSFFQAIRSGKLNVFECLPIIKEMGFDAVEFVDFGIFPDDDLEGTVVKLKAECDKLELEISNFAVGGELLNCQDEEAEIALIKRKIDLAAIMKCPTLRHDITSGPVKGNFKSYDGVLDVLARRCRIITEYAETKGIKTMTENHGFYSQDSTRVESLVNAVNHKNFGLLVDIGNFLCADETANIAVGRTMPYAFYVHVKDFIIKSGNELDPGEGFFMTRGGNYLRGTILGHGEVPVMQCLRIAKNNGYNGYFSIEFEGMEECTKAVSISLSNLKKYVAEVYK